MIPRNSTGCWKISCRACRSNTRFDRVESLAPKCTPCQADIAGLLGRYKVTASGFHLIGKETERAWEQAEDVSTLLPSLVKYGQTTGVVGEQVRQRLRRISLAVLESKTGLSRHTIVRARRGERIHPKSLKPLQIAGSNSLIHTYEDADGNNV